MRKFKINIIKWNLEKYNSKPIFYHKYLTLLLMENANTHLVSVFKDYLLYDDTTEFLKKYFTKKEIQKKLISIFDYYESSSYLFPNYTALNEGKYIYRNIIRKQNLIDYIEDLEDKMKAKKEKIKNKKNKKFGKDEQSSSCFNVFDTNIYNNIIKETGNNSKIDDLFCVKNNKNDDCSDSFISILKLIEEIKENKKKEKENKDNKKHKEIIENKDNKKINYNINSNINLNNINKKIKNRIESKVYVSKRISINSNNSNKLFKKTKPNISINTLLNSNLSNLNSKYIISNDSNKNYLLNSENFKKNEYLKNNLSNISTRNNKNNYKKNNIIINIINNNKTNNFNSNINYYSNYTNSNKNDNITFDNRINYIKSENNKFNNIKNKKYTINNTKTKNNSLIKDKKELKNVILKHSQNQTKKIVNKIKKDIKSKLLSFRFITENSLTDRIKSGQSQSTSKKIGKETSKSKTLISPRNNVKRRTKTEIFRSKKDNYLFGQQNPYNYNKSINRQILKSINLTNTTKPRKDISLINKRKKNNLLGINSSRIETKTIRHISTKSQNLTGIKTINKIVSPLPLKRIVKKKIGVFSFNTERTSRNLSKDKINKNNTLIKKNYLDSFSPKKSRDIIYKKMKRIHNKNSAILCSYFKSIGSSKIMKGLKYKTNNNSNSNSHYKGISSILKNKDKFK